MRSKAGLAFRTSRYSAPAFCTAASVLSVAATLTNASNEPYGINTHTGVSAFGVEEAAGLLTSSSVNTPTSFTPR